MAYVITSSCIGCGACIGECPVEAIEDAGGVSKIDASKCIGCGTCAGSCPVNAIEEQ